MTRRFCSRQVKLSPWLRRPGGSQAGAAVILLGEPHKYAVVSTYRFGSVTITASGGLSLVLRGNVDEMVVLRYVEVSAEGELGMCKTKAFALVCNGETEVALP